MTATAARSSIELSLAKPGKMSKEEYDKAVADLVSYLVWMGEPVAESASRSALVVLIFLALLFVLAYRAEEELLEGHSLIVADGPRRAV
jgi:cytochrome c1